MSAHSDKRDAILSAATTEFALRGYHEAKISEIAKQLGVGHGTVYRHFENKLDLFEQVVARALIKVANIVRAESPERATDLEAFRALIQRLGQRLFILFVQEEPNLARVILEQASGVDDTITARLNMAYSGFADMTERYVQHGVTAGYLRTDVDTRAAARIINGVVLEGVRTALRANEAERLTELALWLQVGHTLIVDGLRVQFSA